MSHRFIALCEAGGASPQAALRGRDGLRPAVGRWRSAGAVGRACNPIEPLSVSQGSVHRGPACRAALANVDPMLCNGGRHGSSLRGRRVPVVGPRFGIKVQPTFRLASAQALCTGKIL
jgi:hypothetical protein